MTEAAAGAAEELHARRDVYRLASRLLAREIDAPLYDRLLTLGLLDGSCTLDDLAAEFCRLFIGPKPVCLPYASARRVPALLHAEPERRFVAFLTAHGLDTVLDPGLTLLGRDHLAVELAVLAHLHDAAAGSPAPVAAAAWQQSRTLVADHLLPWAADVASELAVAARLAPYSLVARSLVALLGTESSLAPPAAAVSPAQATPWISEVGAMRSRPR